MAVDGSVVSEAQRLEKCAGHKQILEILLGPLGQFPNRFAKWHPLKGAYLTRAIQEDVLPSDEAREYLERRHRHTFVVIGIESQPAYENLDALLGVGSIDGIFIGPNDLRFQMRAADGTFPTAEAHEELVQQVITVGKRVGTPTGIHAMDVESALQRVDQGMQFLAIGSDLRMMTMMAQNTVRQLRPAQTKKVVASY